jgi:hypothetical protein
MLNPSSSSSTVPPDWGFPGDKPFTTTKEPKVWENIETHMLGITFFKNIYATTKTSKRMALPEMRDMILATEGGTKGDLPWLKGAAFGDKRTPKDSLRHDENVLGFDLIELDYDKGVMGLDEAITIIKDMNVRALIYSTPSHTPPAPRWRLLMPVSCSLPLEMRAKLCARVNGRFDGIFAPESFTLSQSYYFGMALENPDPDHRCEVIDGKMIDLCDHLYKYQEGGFPKPPGAKEKTTKAKPKTAGSNGGGDFNFEAHLASMGDGIDLNGFNSPLIQATSSWAWHHGSDFDREALKVKLRGAINAAPKGAARAPSDIERYLSDEYLDATITSAVIKYGEVRQQDCYAPAFSEESLALVFANLHQKNLRYVAKWGSWMRWDDVRWAFDETMLAFDLARAVCRKAAGGCNKSSVAKAIASAKTVAAVERLAKADRGIAATVEQWDSSPFKLNEKD